MAQIFVLHAVLLFAYGSALASLILQPETKLGYAGMALATAASILSACASPGDGSNGSVLFGPDFFTVNLMFAGLLLVPPEQFCRPLSLEAVMSTKRREALFYCLFTLMMVQAMAFLTVAPSQAMMAQTGSRGICGTVGSQSLLLQSAEIIVLTDLVRFWLHHAIASLPFMWRFHATPHSARATDWLSGSGLPSSEPAALRYFAAVPMLALGFSPLAVQACLVAFCVSPALLAGGARWFVSLRRRSWYRALEE